MMSDAQPSASPASGERFVVEICSTANPAGRESGHIKTPLGQLDSIGVLIRRDEPNQVAASVSQAHQDHISYAHTGNTVRGVNTVTYGLRVCGRERESGGLRWTTFTRAYFQRGRSRRVCVHS